MKWEPLTQKIRGSRYCNSIPEMDSLSGQKLLRKCGSVISADEALEGKKVVLFYFSARWSPPCAVFTPILNDFYQVVHPVWFIRDTLIKDIVRILATSRDRIFSY